MGRLEAIVKFGPPLINSATPWATSQAQLSKLYECPFTSAVTVRTSTLHGFSHDDQIHQYTFFDTSTLKTEAAIINGSGRRGSLNTLGYSPIPLEQTLANIDKIQAKPFIRDGRAKPWIISITGSPQDVKECINIIGAWKARAGDVLHGCEIFVEINLSCPNITGVPPPAFNADSLGSYLQCIAETGPTLDLAFGIKLPPYSNPDNFQIVKSAIMKYVTSPNEIDGLSIKLDFITTTNTLGCSLLLDAGLNAKLNSADGQGIGGLAGAPLHPLALGNVFLLRKMLDSEPALSPIDIIGIGGVGDNQGFSRMLVAGALVVGIGTAYGVEGIGVFERIAQPAKLDAGHHGPEYVP